MKMFFCELISEIKHGLASFIAVTILIFVGVSAYEGFGLGCESIKASIDREFDIDLFCDFEISGTSLSEKTLSDVLSLDEVTDAEGVYYGYGFFQNGEERCQAKVVSVTERVNTLAVISGRMPDSPDEIAVEKKWAGLNGIGIGDTVTLSGNTFCGTFTVTALATSPAFISDDPTSYGVSPTDLTPINCVMFVSPSAFGERETFSAVVARADALRGYGTFSGGYEEESNRIKSVLEKNLPGATVYARSDNTGVNVAVNSMDMFDALKLSVGGILAAISQFVCCMTIFKTVNSEKKAIGMHKALGMSDVRICSVYVAYSAAASFAGIVPGLLFGRRILERIFVSIAKESIFFREDVIVTPVLELIFTGAAVLVLCAVFAFVTSLLVMHRPISELVTGIRHEKKPRLVLGGRRSFAGGHRVIGITLNNISNDRARVVTTLVSVACCFVMCVSSFAVDDLVSRSFTTHYDKIQAYDTVLYFDPADTESLGKISRLLGEKGYDFSPALLGICTARTPDGKGICAYNMAVPPEEMKKVFSLYGLDGTKKELGDEGVAVTCAYTENYGMCEGDTVSFVTADGTEHEMTVSVICEYYLQMPVIMMSDTVFANEFGVNPVPNCLLCKTNRLALSDISGELQKIPGYIMTYDFYSASKVSFDYMKVACLSVLGVFLFLAVIVAFFVVLNIAVTYVSEKKYELSAMIINGVSSTDAKKCVIYDLLFITVPALVLGNIGGQMLARNTITNLSGYSDYFISEWSIRGSVIGSAVSAALVLAMAFFGAKMTEKLDLTEANTIR